MKTSFVTLLITFAAAVTAGPQYDGEHSILVERKPCYHAGGCSWFGAAKCENYCRGWGQDVGVDRMEKCSWKGDKRCCCSKE
jgi:hypothetical protein